MAEVTAMRNNALPYPVYGVTFTVTFPLLDADGDPISPSSPDSEVSKNGDTFADCTNEAVEIASSSGVCYLILTAAEMTADIVTVQIKSTGAKTTVLTLYPRKLPVLSSGTCQGSNDTGDIQLASGDSAVDDIYNGCLCVAVIDSTTEARIINDYVGSTKVAEVSPAWNTAQPDSNDTYTIYLPEGRQVQQANTTHLAGTAQTARDIGASVLLSNGTGTGQLKLASGYVAMTWADIAAPTTTVNLSGTTVKDATDVNTDTDTLLSRMGTPSNLGGGATLSANLSDIEGQTDDIGAAGAGLTAADDAILTAIAALNNLSQAQAQSASESALQTYHLDHLIQSADPGSIVANSSLLAKLVSKSATPAFTSYDNTTDSLEALRDNVGTAGAGLTAADDAVITAIAALNNLSSAQAQTAAESALQTYHLDHFIHTADPGSIVADSSFLAKLVSKSATPSFASYNNTTDSHEALRDRGDAAWITATGFSTHSAADVWSVATRVLTAGTNIALAKGTGVTGFNDVSVSDIWTTALTEAYRGTGATGTGAQLCYEILSLLGEFSISGTTLTTKKLDGSTTAKTYTLNHATTPTGITEAT